MRLVIGIFSLFLFVLCTFGRQQVDAETQIIPNRDLTIVKNNDTLLNLNLSSLDSITCDTSIFGIVSESGVTGVCVKDTTLPGTYTGNLATAHFSNIGSINGRKLNAEFRVLRYEMLDTMINPYGEMYSRVFGVSANKINVYCGSKSGGNKVDCSLKIIWADTGEIVNLPFFHSICDFDIVASMPSVYHEAITFTSGYQDLFYVWEDLDSQIIGNKFSSAVQGINYEGDDSWLRSGGIVPTINGDLRFSIEGYYCGDSILLQSSYLDLISPSKSVDSSINYKLGDTVEWSIDKRVKSFYTEVLTQYQSLVFKDVIPEEVDYVSCKMYDDGVDVTSQYGTPNYNPTTRAFTYTFNSTTLQRRSFYDGGTLKLVLNTTVNDKATGTVSNTPIVILNGIELEGNEVDINVVHRITTEVEGPGTISGYIENIQSGSSKSVTYQPNTGCYLAELYVDGTKVSVEGNLTQYAFTNITSNHHVKAIFKTNPKLTIEKQVLGNPMPVFGSEEFFFKVSGTSRDGEPITLYKHLQGSNSATFAAPVGIYTVEELPVDRYTLTEVVGVKNADTNGSCNLLNGDAHVLFKNQLTDYKGYGHNGSVTNDLK